jgi:hypothetical protein
MPSIIEAWFIASEKTCMPGKAINNARRAA